MYKAQTLNYGINPSQITQEANNTVRAANSTNKMLNTMFDSTKKVLETKMLSDETKAKFELSKKWNDIQEDHRKALEDPANIADETKYKAMTAQYDAKVKMFKDDLSKAPLSIPTMESLSDKYAEHDKITRTDTEIKRMKHVYSEDTAKLNLHKDELMSTMKDDFMNAVNDGNIDPMRMKVAEDKIQQINQIYDEQVKTGRIAEADAKEDMTSTLTKYFVEQQEKTLTDAIDHDPSLSEMDKIKKIKQLENNFNYKNYDEAIKGLGENNKYFDKELSHNYAKTYFEDKIEKIKEKARAAGKHVPKFKPTDNVVKETIDQDINSRDYEKAVDDLYGKGTFANQFNGKRYTLFTNKSGLYDNDTLDNAADPNNNLTVRAIDSYASKNIKDYLSQHKGALNDDDVDYLVNTALDSGDIVDETDEKYSNIYLKDLSAQTGIPFEVLNNRYKADKLKRNLDKNKDHMNPAQVDLQGSAIQEFQGNYQSKMADFNRRRTMSGKDYVPGKVYMNASKGLGQWETQGGDLETYKEYMDSNRQTYIVDSDGNLTNNLVRSEDIAGAIKDSKNFKSEITSGSVFGFGGKAQWSTESKHKLTDIGISDTDVAMILPTEYKSEVGTEVTDKQIENLTGHFMDYIQNGTGLGQYNKALMYEGQKYIEENQLKSTGLSKDFFKQHPELVEAAKRDMIRDFASRSKPKTQYSKDRGETLNNVLDYRNQQINQSNAEGMAAYNKAVLGANNGMIANSFADPSRNGNFVAINGNPNKAKTWDENSVCIPNINASQCTDYTDAYTFIAKQEGLSTKAYLDSNGKYSVGYGVQTINGKPVTKDTVISQEDAMKTMKADADQRAKQLHKMLGKTKLSQNQFNAILSLSYNIGMGNIGRSTLLKKIKSGDYAGAANEFKKWNKVKGKLNKNLVNRRELEAYMFAGINKN